MAETVREAGLTPWSAQGTADRQAWVANLADRGLFGKKGEQGFARSADGIERDRILRRGEPKDSKDEELPLRRIDIPDPRTVCGDVVSVVMQMHALCRREAACRPTGPGHHSLAGRDRPGREASPPRFGQTLAAARAPTQSAQGHCVQYGNRCASAVRKSRRAESPVAEVAVRCASCSIVAYLTELPESNEACANWPGRRHAVECPRFRTCRIAADVDARDPAEQREPGQA